MRDVPLSLFDLDLETPDGIRRLDNDGDGLSANRPHENLHARLCDAIVVPDIVEIAVGPRALIVWPTDREVKIIFLPTFYWRRYTHFWNVFGLTSVPY